MKYYNLNGTLVVALAAGLEIQCTIETIEVAGHSYDKLFAAFTFDSPFFQDNPLLKVPLSKQQATRLFLRFRERDAAYRNCCEIWWRLKLHHIERHALEGALISMTEWELDVPKPIKVEQFFWQKPYFAFPHN